MKVSKVVLIVVALHVLVIGGIFIFEGCSRAKTQVTDMTAATPNDETAANASALPTDSTATTAQNMTPTSPQAGSLAPTPVTPTVAPAAPTPVAKTYVVKKGDTIAKIAKTQGTTQVELSKANHLTKVSILKIGQKLTIPGKAEAATTQVAAAAPAPAAAGGVDAAPTAAAGGTSYTVKSGDSLWKIAKAHNISVASIKQANNLSSDALKVNQKITIPAGATQSTQTAQAGIAPATYSEWQPGAHTEGGQTVHVVDIGESPAAIAKKYNVTVDQLMKANSITDSKRIMVGQKLIIPGATQQATTAAPTPTPAVAAPIVTTSN